MSQPAEPRVLVVDAHGGRVEAANADGGGAVFLDELPLAGASAPAGDPGAEAAAG
jgi:hypothetical protein